jgi:hypothetical protein
MFQLLSRRKTLETLAVGVPHFKTKTELALQIMLQIRGWTDGSGYRQYIQQDRMCTTRSTDQMIVHTEFGK